MPQYNLEVYQPHSGHLRLLFARTFPLTLTTRPICFIFKDATTSYPLIKKLDKIITFKINQAESGLISGWEIEKARMSKVFVNNTISLGQGTFDTSTIGLDKNILHVQFPSGSKPYPIRSDLA